MNWVTIIWAMIASACLTLALVHVLVWWHRPEARANLLFALMATATAVFAGCELWMMRAETPIAFGTAVRWGHVPIWVLFVSLVGFVRLYLRAGRSWLAWTACGLRTLSLILDFVFNPNLNYREITALRDVSFLGERVVVADGIPNSWMLIGQLSLLLLVIFVADAAISVWQRGDRRQALSVGGSIVFFVVAGTVQTMLIFWGIIHTPITASVFFMAIVAAMGYELSQDVFRAARLSDDLRDSEERMNLAAEAANLGMWVWDVVRDEVWMTEKGRALLGFAQNTRLDASALISRVHPEDREARAGAIKHAIETQGEYSTEYRVLLPDGRLRWIGARGHCIHVGDPKGIRLLGVSIDVTAQKQAEAQTRQHREEIAHLSRVAIMGEMAGSLAHELNQPLTAIVNNASAGRRFIAKGRADLPKLDSLFEAVVSDGRRGGEIIRGIRGMMRKGEEVRRPVNLNDVIGGVLGFVRSDALERHCALVAEPDPELPLVEADLVQIQQVLLNLVVNAFEAMREMPPATRRVIIRSERESHALVRVSVRDFGTGLPVEERRIFDRFFSTKREGMGMGLAIARSIIVAHSGELAAANAPDGGACVHFLLPVIAEGNGG